MVPSIGVRSSSRSAMMWITSPSRCTFPFTARHGGRHDHSPLRIEEALPDDDIGETGFILDGEESDIGRARRGRTTTWNETSACGPYTAHCRQARREDIVSDTSENAGAIEPPVLPPKVDPEMLVLRGKPARAIRFKRGAS